MSNSMNNPNARQIAKWSLVSVTLTATITSIHHIYRLGFDMLIPAIIITIVPYLLMQAFKRWGNRLVLLTYSLFTTFIFLMFGIVDGFMDHVVKALGLQHTTFLAGGQEQIVKTVLSLWSPEAGNIFYEGTGILTFIVSVIALYYCYRFVWLTIIASKNERVQSSEHRLRVS